MPRTVTYFDPIAEQDLEGLRVDVTHGKIERVVGDVRIRSSGSPAPDLIVGGQITAAELPAHVREALQDLARLVCGAAMFDAGMVESDEVTDAPAQPSAIALEPPSR